MKLIVALLPSLLLSAAHHVGAFSATTPSPKQALAQLVVENLKTDPDKLSPALVATKKQEFESILEALYAENKGFSAETVEGEWTSVLSLPGKKSRQQQSLVGNRIEKAGTTMANFVGDLAEIQVSALTPRENGIIRAVLSYQPVGDNFSIDKSTNGNKKIVLRRIACDNVKATLKYKRLPTVPIPFFKRKGGWLDFIYLDDDVRVTKGNRGGQFVHFRPAYLEKVMKEY